MEEHEIYPLLGEEGFRRLVAAFFRQIPNDEILGSIYPKHDLAGAEQRLRDFLIFRFGGPQRYIEQRGHPRLRMRHVPFKVDRAARDRWVQAMGRALDEVDLAPEAKQIFKDYIESTATGMINWPRPGTLATLEPQTK